MSRNFPSLLLSFAWLLTAIVLCWFGWYTYDTYNKNYEKHISDIRIEAVRGEIIHYDEILTMSTRMAAATGDPQWEQRYRKSELLLNDAIQRAKKLAGEAYSQEASALTAFANQKLVAMEHQAFDLIHQGRLDEAKDILSGATYLIQKRLYSVGMARFPVTRFTSLRLVELQGIILHLDEVLTMSARMAVITGDAKWEIHYHQFVSLLDDAIRESIVLAPNVAGGKAAEQTDQANQKLVEMELKAFKFIQQGLPDEAHAILFSQAYEEQKQNYVSGMEQFITELNKTSEAITHSEYQKILWNITAAFLAIAFLLIGWLYVLRVLNIWHKEQKQAKAALVISEEKFSKCFRNSPEGVVISSLSNGRIVDVSDNVERLTGYQHDQIIGQSVIELGIWKDLEVRADMVKVLQNKGVIQNICVDMYKREGELRQCELSVEVIKIDNEPCMITNIRDITDRKRAEKALKESNERFKAAYADAAIGMALVSLDHRIFDANQSFCNMLGYSKEEIKGVFIKEITHPDDVDISLESNNKLIIGEIDNYQFEKRYLHKQGREVWALLSVSLVRDKNTNPLYTITAMQDITEHKRADKQLTHQASHDSLTGLVNRREFERRAERLLATVKQDKSEHALCFMDLDQFKVVNDTCGHVAGDEMLRQISSLLEQTVRHRDTLARLGGDEFGVLMEHCSLDDAHRVTTSLLSAVQNYQFSWEEHTFKIGVSMGLVPITEMTANLTELLKAADAACYIAKDKGRNRIHVHHADDTEMAQRHGEMQWVERLHQALEEDRFCLYAQTIVPLDGGIDKHYELLIRMVDEKGELIPPGAFLPAAERYDLISKIDRWVIEHAFDLLADNPVFLSQINFISINLSGQSLTSPEILKFIITQLDGSEIQNEKICFEITETAAISNLSGAVKFISTLKGLGCRFALDDFGSGLSSFAYLKNLPVDYLKIDGMFVKNIVDDPIDHAMVKSINEIGHVMGMQTIAEFVENDEVKGMLKEIGVDYAQGYGIGKPQPFDKFLKMNN